MKYAIHDNITGQYLSKYDSLNDENWGWDGWPLEDDDLIRGLHVFNSKAEVEKAVDHLNKVFIAAGEKVDFRYFPVREFKIYKKIKE